MAPPRVIHVETLPAYTEVHCDSCGDVLPVHDSSRLWRHPCFDWGSPETHIFQFTEKGRLFIMLISDLDQLDLPSKKFILEHAPYRGSTSPPATDSGYDSYDISDTSFNGEINSHESSEQDDPQLSFDRQLVKHVSEKENIWNHTIDVQLRTKALVLKSWVEISNILNKSVPDLQKRWTYLFKKYKEVKEQTNPRSAASGNSSNSVQAVLADEISRDFPLFEDMKFVDYVVTPVCTSDSLPDSEASVQPTVDQYNRILGNNEGKTKGRKRSRVCHTGDELSIKDVVDILKENKDPENELLTGILHTVKGAMKRIPEKYWFRIHSDLIGYFEDKIEQYGADGA